mgnify:CR=1 FL=1
MAHLVQAAVWTAGLDDRLTDSGLISFQLCKAYAPPVGVKGQISTVCLYTAGGNLASKDNFILFYLGRFDGGTVFRCIMISPGKVFLGRIEDEGEIRVPAAASLIPSMPVPIQSGANERKSAGVLTGL